MAGLGVGLIGTGYMGKCHALAWNSVAPVFGDVERPRLVVLGEADEALAERKARELGFETATSDWKALVADPGSAVARQSLYEVLKQKIQFLQNTIALMNEMRQGDAAGAAQIVESGKS